MIMMRSKVLIDGTSGKIISSLAREMGCESQDRQISVHFGSPRYIKYRTLPPAHRRRLTRHTTANGSGRESKELPGKGGRRMDGPNRTQNRRKELLGLLDAHR